MRHLIKSGFGLNLIGIGLILIGAVLGAIAHIIIPFGIFNVCCAILVFIGGILFGSLPSEDTFYDYRIANSDTVLLRKRHYLNFLPITYVSLILTLGTAAPKIVWKEEYFKFSQNGENAETIKLSRKEYVALRNEQRIIYSTQVLSKEFMESSYTKAAIGFNRKKTRLIVVSILAAIIIPGGISDPNVFYLLSIYEPIFLFMIILWFPEYKDAKILHQAYDRAINAN